MPTCPAAPLAYEGDRTPHPRLLAGIIITAPWARQCHVRPADHHQGLAIGIISGLGSALADSIYAAIAGFSISFIIQFLLREIFWIRLFAASC